MANLLKQRGFEKVIVLEKKKRIGGKSKTVFYDKVPYELGTVFAGAAYATTLDLLKEFGLDPPIHIGKLHGMHSLD